MARVRSGNTGFAVTLVIFGCGFVIATLLAIIFYTKIEAAEAGVEDALADRRKYVADNETAAASDFLSDGNTAFTTMREKIRDLEDQVKNSRDDVTRLTATTEKMQSDFTTERKIKSDVQAKLEQERETHAAMMQKIQDQADALMREKNDLVAQVTELQNKVTAAIQNADQAARDRIDELTTQINAMDAQLAQLELDKQDALLLAEQYREKLPKLPAPNTALPDGKIASVVESSNNLFITLGRRQNLVIGMTFEVFDPDPVLKLTNQGDARGKATIEVYSLTDDSAACRIVRRELGARISPGDPIVNLAYDPMGEVQMFAFGYFDIESDGGASDLARINTLIQQHGAKIPEMATTEDGTLKLSPDLDYIVLGTKPDLPEKPGEGGDFDPEAIQIYQAKLAEMEAYFRIVEEAKQLGIPVLNQSRFLTLTGYYVR